MVNYQPASLATVQNAPSISHGKVLFKWHSGLVPCTVTSSASRIMQQASRALSRQDRAGAYDSADDSVPGGRSSLKPPCQPRTPTGRYKYPTHRSNPPAVESTPQSQTAGAGTAPPTPAPVSRAAVEIGLLDPACSRPHHRELQSMPATYAPRAVELRRRLRPATAGPVSRPRSPARIQPRWQNAAAPGQGAGRRAPAGEQPGSPAVSEPRRTADAAIAACSAS